MFIFLYGTDNYRSRQKLNEIIKHYKKIHKNELNLRYFDGENLNFQDFREKIQQFSIFKEKKLIILFNFFSNTRALAKGKDERSSSLIEIKKRFLEEEAKNKFLSKIEEIIVFYEEEKVSEKDAFYFFLKKHAQCQEFKLLDEQKLKNWIEKEFLQYHFKINQKTIQTLINFVGNDLWQLSNEIRKLVSYKKNQKVEVEDVKLLVKPKIEVDVFKTIDAIALKDKKGALFLIHKHLEKGDNPLYLLSMINFQFRNLLIIKDLIEKNRPFYTFGKKTQLHPYVIKKTYSQTQKFTIEELKKIYQKIFQADLDIKTGKLNPQIALDLFIAQISSYSKI
jgi:DNA polymerase-3 subunit delta